MITFRMLWEMPTLMKPDELTHNDRFFHDPEPDADERHDMGAHPLGHRIVRAFDHTGTLTFSAEKDGENHVRVHANQAKGPEGDEWHVTKLSASPVSKIRAHELYHHLVAHHGMTLVSDQSQSVGGMKVWQRLHGMPGVSVRVRSPEGKETVPHEDWSDNYGDRSVLVARKI